MVRSDWSFPVSSAFSSTFSSPCGRCREPVSSTAPIVQWIQIMTWMHRDHTILSNSSDIALCINWMHRDHTILSNSSDIALCINWVRCHGSVIQKVKLKQLVLLERHTSRTFIDIFSSNTFSFFLSFLYFCYTFFFFLQKNPIR